MKIKSESEILKFIGEKKIDYDTLIKNIDTRVFWRLLRKGIVYFDDKTRMYGVK